MKRTITLFVSLLFTGSVSAQEVRLNDSVIFINNYPVAFYSKTLNNTPLRYDIEVYNTDDYVLIKAETVKFESPLTDPEAFYYYEISFPPLADTFSIYIIDEAFPLVLGRIIKDYDLISNNQLNVENVKQFKSSYYGGPALTTQIKMFTENLNKVLHLDEQVVRDRSKPVSLIQNKIMQDGKIIGTINMYTENKVTSERRLVGTTLAYTRKDGMQYNKGIYSTVYQNNPYNRTEIAMPNGRIIDFKQFSRLVTNEIKLKGKQLWKKSESVYGKNKKLGQPAPAPEYICSLIEGNAL